MVIENKRPNVIVEKSLEFAVMMVRLTNLFPKTLAGYALGGQIVRSGTSIGANIQESQRARSKADFVNCMSIALKEASETMYWLKVIESSKLACVSAELINNLEEIIKLLVAIIKKSKSNS